jgi:hypothetical protein
MNIWRLLIVVLSVIVLLSSTLAPPPGHVLVAVLFAVYVWVTFFRQTSHSEIPDDPVAQFIARAVLTSRAPPIS